MLAYGAFLDLTCFLKFILMMIIPLLGLLAWAEKKVSNSNEVNQHYSMGEELVQTSDEIGQLFEQDHEENTVVRAYCACSFCGKLSHITTTCLRCKAALYCSKVCHVMHWRFWHKYECVEIAAAEDQEGSPSHGTHCLLIESENESSKYSSFTEVEQKTDVGEVYYIEGGEKQNSVESSDGTASPRLGYNGCAVCGNPSTKKCSRCKAIKYCSQTCQHLDWRSGHKFQCVVEKANSTQAATVNQERPAHGNVILPTNSCGVEDNANSYGPYCLEFYSEGNTNAKALILSSQEATNTGQKEIEEQLRSLKEELAKIKNENMSLQSERDNWEMQARHAEDRLYSFRKESEHQLFILKHENELISNAEKRACQMVHSLSQRLHCLQIEVETGVAERRKQEECMRMLQNECAKAKTELQEQKRCVQRLSVGLDEATQFPMRIAEETRQKLANALRTVAAAEVKLDHPERKITKPDDKVFQTISLSRNPTYTRQACAICLANEKDMAFGCGHMTCRDCGSKIRKCHICRKKITSRIRLFPG